MSGQRHCLLTWVQTIGFFPLSLIAALGFNVPTHAAETIYFQYGQLERSLQVNSLKTFAETGEVNPDLAGYFQFLKVDEPTQQEFRQALTARTDVDLVYLSRFLYTQIGEDFLEQFGSYIRTEAGNNGRYALRAAILLAAAEPEGISLLTVLQQYPTDMRIRVHASLQVANAASIVLDATDFFTDAIAQLSEQEAQSETSVDFMQLADLRQSGPFGVQQRRWQLWNEERDRTFYVDLYQPQRWRPGQAPVVIISHGLASDPESFAARAEYLASYGYVVAVPQHPGSDSAQARNVVNGLSRDVFLTEEFIDRPRDISDVLDELERRNESEFEGRLNVQSVGAIGHSFGGYTVMALAGATINFDQLQASCQNNLEYLDLSLFVQCRALDLPHQPYDFRDSRIKAVYALNPVNNSIFGEEGLSQITVPIFLEAGTHDPATPAVFEQVRSFVMLTTPKKYLAILEGQAHVDFSNLDAGLMDFIESISSLNLPPPDLLNSYSQSLMLAFLEVSLLDNEAYQPYLQASYTDYLSRNQEFKVFLISAGSVEGLKQASERFRSGL